MEGIEVTNVIINMPAGGRPFASLNGEPVECLGWQEFAMPDGGRTLIATLAKRIEVRVPVRLTDLPYRVDPLDFDPAMSRTPPAPGFTTPTAPAQPKPETFGTPPVKRTMSEESKMSAMIKRAKRMRLKAGQTQAEIAAIIGWSAATISAMENESGELAPAKRHTIAKAVVGHYVKAAGFGSRTGSRELPISNPFGQALRDARKAKGDRAQDLADTFGVTASYVAQIERNPSQSPKFAMRLADFYGVPIPATI